MDKRGLPESGYKDKNIAQTWNQIKLFPAAYDFTSGVAVHWYMDGYPGLGSTTPLEEVNQEFPEKFILYTEACAGNYLSCVSPFIHDL